MQLNINYILQISIGIIFLIMIILVACLIVSINKLSHFKKKNCELLEGIDCKDGVINEFTKIRHEYNNMLQTITCLIEEEDLDGLKECKSEFLNKARLLNSNSITQMVKIKDINILRLIYKLILNAKEEGVVLIITIFNDIANQNLNADEIYYALKDCLINVYQSGAKQAMLINLKISSSDSGLCFKLENESNIESRELFSQTMKARKNYTKNNIIFNTFYENTLFIQEIIIS
ncbi:hypothetical protein [[Clostridium] fimetarium]|uniref:Sensor_kinase_SpoOB-type, alpha-helical domain n=1 Tax=[Clostridium] fimetarium TaxID=99656 RepID=A0A1I0PHR4_9FIRM|nr:hypothetical protein [[Clostridium] fimetarium]SEW13998.1 hypothetical protein SAMN05421659_105102 [[Clostridium] fimetarium]